jgi:hypothetical protein
VQRREKMQAHRASTLVLVCAREEAGDAGRKTARLVLPELPETNGAKKIEDLGRPRHK